LGVSIGQSEGWDDDASEHLIDAKHIFFDYGVLDAFGHVSVRSESEPNAFLLARNVALAVVPAGTGWRMTYPV
jgi:hypothetical protein